MTLIRFFPAMLLVTILTTVLTAQTPPVNNDMQQFLQNRLQTLKQNETQLKADAAANPGNMTTQLDLASVTQEIQQLEAVLGTQTQAPTTPAAPNALNPAMPANPLGQPTQPGFNPLQTNPFNPMTGMVGAGMVGAGIPGVDTHALQPIKDGLMMELKNLQGSLAQVNAQTDPQFYEMLQGQQAELLRQIQDVDAQMKAPTGVPGYSGGLQSPMPPNRGWGGAQPSAHQGMPMNQEAMNWQNMLNQVPTANTAIPDPMAERISSLEKAAEQLRAAGQHSLADQTLVQAEQLRQIGTTPSAAIPPTSPAVPQPTPYSPDMAAYASPWMTQPAKEIVDLKNSVDSLRAQIEQMQAGINALENQLQLLNRNMVHETGRLDQILNQGAPSSLPTTPQPPASVVPLAPETGTPTAPTL